MAPIRLQKLLGHSQAYLPLPEHPGSYQLGTLVEEDEWRMFDGLVVDHLSSLNSVKTSSIQLRSWESSSSRDVIVTHGTGSALLLVWEHGTIARSIPATVNIEE